LPEKVFPLASPYHHAVIGSHADLAAAKVDDVRAFFDTYYVASNASLVVTGDIDPAAARGLVEKYFGEMPRRPEPPHAVFAPSPVRAERVSLEDQVDHDQVTLAWASPALFGPADAETTLLAALLGGGKSSRLSRALVFDQQIAQSVEVEQRGLQYGGSFVIQATAQGSHDALELERALDRELEDLETHPPSDGEIDQARAFVETRVLEGVESPSGLADALNEFEFLFGDPGQLERSSLARFSHISASAVAECASLLRRPRVVITVHPSKRARPPRGKRAS
jgi:zinc protease